MNRSVGVTIAGHHYMLRSDENDTYVRRLATLVDRRFHEIESSTKQVSTHAIAMLTALQLADDLLKEKRKRAALREKVRDRSQKMLQIISRQLQE